MIQSSLKILKSMQNPSGLFVAAADKRTHYSKQAWLRDNVYATLGLEATKNIKEVIKAYHALLNIFLKHEYKIDWAIKEKPKHRYQYIHARYDPQTLEEFWEDWGNKQNDAIGAILFKIGDLESKGIKIIRNNKDIRILKKMVQYLASIEYWKDQDSGMWEENEEIHASSIGACVAGLKKISLIINIPQDIIIKGEKALNKILPNESPTKKTDLALLSLIYPYNIVTEKQKFQILKNIESKLKRQRGILRYLNDTYFNKNGEAEWCFGFPWLAIIYKDLNNPRKYAHYMRKTVNLLNEKGELPELYYCNSKEYNENTPLGWGQSLLIVAKAME